MTRVVLIINFDIGKHKRSIYKHLIEKDVSIKDRKITHLQQKLYLIEYSFDFNIGSTMEDQKNNLFVLLEEFKQEGNLLQRKTYL